MKPGRLDRARRWPRIAALLLLAAIPAHAREVLHDDRAVVDVTAFYKTLFSGLVLQPDAVTAAEGHAALLEEASREAPAGLFAAVSPEVPEAGALDTHTFRLGSRVLLDDTVELEVAYQLGLALASDPAFAGAGATGGTVGGTGPGAQRRLVDLEPALAHGPSWRLEQNLDRLSLKVPLPFGDLTVGRQVLSWGTGRLWNPTDVLSPFPPTAVDREVRRGFDAVRLAVALSEVSQLDLLYLPQPELEDMGGVVRVQGNLEGWDGSVSLGKYVDDLLIGADLVGDLGPVGVHAEGAYTLQVLGMGTPDPLSVGEHFFRGVVGAELRPHEKLVLLAEYAFNGYGTTVPSRYAAVLASPRVVRGEVFGAGKHQAALAASFLANDLLSMQLSVLSNVSDPSAVLIPSLEYAFSQTVLLRAGGYVPLGRGPDPNAFAGLTTTDVLTGSERYRAAVASRGLRSEYGSGSYAAFVQLGVYVP